MPTSAEGPLRDFPDRAIRDALRHRANLRELLRAAAPGLAEAFDCDRAELLDRDFPLEDWRRREADLLFRMPFRDGGDGPPALVCVLVEHQSAPDPRMPLRMLLYAALFWEREWKAWEGSPTPRGPLRLSPVVPIVFHTGATPWRAGRELADLIADPGPLGDFAPRWRTIYWDLSEQPPREVSEAAGEFLAALAVVRAEREDSEAFRAVFEAVVRRLEPLHDEDRLRWGGLLRMVLSWAYFRRPSGEMPALVAAAQASQTSFAIREEVRAMAGVMGQSMAERIWDESRAAALAEGLAEGRTEGLAEGLAEGRAEGLAEGRAQGELENSREILRRLLERRFGALPEPLSRRIESSTDAGRLMAAIEMVLTIDSPDQLAL